MKKVILALLVVGLAFVNANTQNRKGYSLSIGFDPAVTYEDMGTPTYIGFDARFRNRFDMKEDNIFNFGIFYEAHLSDLTTIGGLGLNFEMDITKKFTIGLGYMAYFYSNRYEYESRDYEYQGVGAFVQIMYNINDRFGIKVRQMSGSDFSNYWYEVDPTLGALFVEDHSLTTVALEIRFGSAKNPTLTHL